MITKSVEQSYISFGQSVVEALSTKYEFCLDGQPPDYPPHKGGASQGGGTPLGRAGPRGIARAYMGVASAK